MRVPPFEFAIRREEKIAVEFSTSIPSSVLGSFTFEEKRLDGSWTRLGASSGVERRVYDYDMTGCCLPLKPHKTCTMIYYHAHGLRFEFACLSVPLGCLTLFAFIGISQSMMMVLMMMTMYLYMSLLVRLADSR